MHPPTASAVPAGQNTYSRGHQPTKPSQNTFDPAGVALAFNIPPWASTHGYSCLTVSRSYERGYLQSCALAAESSFSKGCGRAVGNMLPDPKARLKDQFHEVARFKHSSLRTEENYWE